MGPTRSHSRINEVRIGSWNIHGAFKRIGGFQNNKLIEDYVQNIVTQNHIFCMSETHHVASQTDELHINGYQSFGLCRKKTKIKPVEDW